MRITTVRFGKVAPNGKQYSTDRVEMEAVVQKDDTVKDVLAELRRKVNDALGLGPSPSQINNAKRTLADAGFDIVDEEED